MRSRTTTMMILAVLVMTAGLASTGVATAQRAPGRSVTKARAAQQPKVVKIRITEKRIKLSDTRFRPGVTEFRVKSTTKRRSTATIAQTADLARAFKLIGIATSGKAGSADAMKKFDRITTLYGGGREGARWQVRLKKGDFYMVDGASGQVTPFTVQGERRHASMHSANMEVWTTKDNQFDTSGDLSGPWIGFKNDSREVHFLEADRVKNDTTAKEVRKSFQTGNDDYFRKGGGFFFEIQSPGIRTVHRQDVEPGRYLLTCWMPSEEQDGVPHAMMGMWRLVNAA